MHIIFIYNPFPYVISKYWTELWCNHIDSSIILNWNWCSKTSSTKKYTFYDWIAKHCINFVPDRIHCASLQCLDIQIIPDICIGHLSYSVRACMFASCKTFDYCYWNEIRFYLQSGTILFVYSMEMEMFRALRRMTFVFFFHLVITEQYAFHVLFNQNPYRFIIVGTTRIGQYFLLNLIYINS